MNCNPAHILNIIENLMIELITSLNKVGSVQHDQQCFSLSKTIKTDGAVRKENVYIVCSSSLIIFQLQHNVCYKAVSKLCTFDTHILCALQQYFTLDSSKSISQTLCL